MATNDELAQRAAELRDGLAALEGELGIDEQLERTVERQGRSILAMAIFVTVDILLTIGGIYTYNRVTDTARRVDQVQAVVNRDVLCPLYDVFLGSYRPERQPPEDLATYEASFNVIRAGHRTLRCG